jgi:hypothetical protein
MPHQHVYSDHNGTRVFTVDDPAAAGSLYFIESDAGESLDTITFQTGSPAEVGINGVTNEHLMAILIHRINILDSKQPSLFNKAAIECVKEALGHLEARTHDRQVRGVEGMPAA